MAFETLLIALTTDRCGKALAALADAELVLGVDIAQLQSEDNPKQSSVPTVPVSETKGARGSAADRAQPAA